ncbi:hypothetical protein V5G20_17990 [Brevibacillus borstelensis]|uniref:hypothetical protein n=1 Tax=Brevibacillus borstelensis TaxID=45462 RepID=UPI0030D1303E
MLVIWLMTYLLIGLAFARIDVDTDGFKRKLTESPVEKKELLAKVYFPVCILLWPVRVVAVIVRIFVGEKK